MNIHARGESDDVRSRMTYGIEWGYVATFQYGYHNYFIAPEGYRVEEKVNMYGLIDNAEMHVNVGYDFDSRWNLSLYIGYEGIGDTQKAVPVSLRLTRSYRENRMGDRWFTFADFGSGICIKKHPQEIFTSKIGAGYSLSLSEFASIDFLISARLTHTHQDIYYDNTLIPFEKTNRNLVNASALSFGMALKF